MRVASIAARTPPTSARNEHMGWLRPCERVPVRRSFLSLAMASCALILTQVKSPMNILSQRDLEVQRQCARRERPGWGLSLLMRPARAAPEVPFAICPLCCRPMSARAIIAGSLTRWSHGYLPSGTTNFHAALECLSTSKMPQRALHWVHAQPAHMEGPLIEPDAFNQRT
jgi:hypothetical protein